jgi:hypothetical protein
VQPARPVRLPSGPPSSTQVSTCRSRSMRRCGRSPSMSGSKSTISCLRVSMRHCDGVGIHRLRASRLERSGRPAKGHWPRLTVRGNYPWSGSDPFRRCSSKDTRQGPDRRSRAGSAAGRLNQRPVSRRLQRRGYPSVENLKAGKKR